MQMYRGLPITTNKLTEKERRNIPHWIFDQIGLEETPWTVQKFQTESRKIIQQIHLRGRLPILVGGTHYYTEAVLFNGRTTLNDPARELSDEEQNKSRDAKRRGSILDRPTAEIWNRLHEVDPQMADRWHPNDRRKIQRSLEIWLETGKTASQTYRDQCEATGTSQDDQHKTCDAKGREAANHYDSLVFWLQTSREVLKARLEDRVESMLDAGLLQEAQEIMEQEQKFASGGSIVDRSKGIWASIGYKELTPYLEAMHKDENKPSSNELEKIKLSCISAIKAATCRYAQRQDRWIRIHLLNTLSRVAGERPDSTKMYPLDCTNIDEGSWHSHVYEPCATIVSAFLAGDKLPPSSLPLLETSMQSSSTASLAQDKHDIGVYIDRKTSESRKRRHCAICNKTMMTEKEWSAHMSSNSHRKAVAGRRKWEAFQEWRKQACNDKKGESKE